MSRIWIPKLKIFEPAPICRQPARAEGFFSFETVNRYGRVTRRLDARKQLITDHGMDLLIGGIAGNYHLRCHVGTGSPTFSFASTGLDNPIAGTGTISSNSNSSDTAGTDGYRQRHNTTWEFTLGGIVANLTEVGIFTADNNTTATFLDVFRDSGGSPTSFPVTADDQLRVTHVVDVYPALVDLEGSFTVGGSAGSGSHDFVGRAANMAQNSNSIQNRLALGNLQWGGWHSVSSLGAVTAGITGSLIGGGGSTSWSAPSDDGTTWTRTTALTGSLSQWNNLNGLEAIIGNSGSGVNSYKLLFDPPIPKFADSVQRILTLNLAASLERG